MKSWNEHERLLSNTLATYGVRPPRSPNPRNLYLWSSPDRLEDEPTPIAGKYQVGSLDNLQAVRHVPLLLIPRLDPTAGQTALLFKDDARWNAVLPSVELSPIQSELDYVHQSIERYVRTTLGFDETPTIQPAGGLISCKHSPSYGESSCFVFPLFTVHTASSDVPDVRGYRFLGRGELLALQDAFRQPNGDVYQGIDRLFPSWHELLDLSPSELVELRARIPTRRRSPTDV